MTKITLQILLLAIISVVVDIPTILCKQMKPLQPPKGIIFHGPPGTGKTLLAKTMANEFRNALGGKKPTFIYHKGCESNSSFFGESEEKLRALFAVAIQHKPAIIFFDDLDELCPNRDKAAQSSEACAGVVTTLSGLIDSVTPGDIFLIGATNRLDAIDAAVIRPGIFDKDLQFPLPDNEGRTAIIQIHTRKWLRDVPTGDQLEHIAKTTIGYSGADLAKLCQDTLGQARIRLGPVPAYQITITPADWTKALGEMEPSRLDVFGSTLMTAKPPLPAMVPLVAAIAIDDPPLPSLASTSTKTEAPISQPSKDTNPTDNIFKQPTIKGDGTSFKEDLIISLKAELLAEIKDELHDELCEELKDDLKQQLKETLRDEVKEELVSELRNELLEEIKNDLIEELRDELRDQIKEELLSEFRDELVDELKDELKAEIEEEIENEVL